MEKEIKTPDEEKSRDRVGKKEMKEEGEVFYKAHPISATHTQVGVSEYEETRAASVVAEGVLWWLLVIVDFFLLVRMVFAGFASDGGNIITSFVYTVTYPFVWFFFYLFNTLGQINVSNPTFELETLAAMLFYYIVVYIVVQLIQGFSGNEE